MAPWEAHTPLRPFTGGRSVVENAVLQCWLAYLVSSVSSVLRYLAFAGSP